MAIQLKTATLVADWDYISLHDEAMDDETDGFQKLYEDFVEGRGPAPLKDGVEPTVWKLAHLSDVRTIAKLDGIRTSDGNTAWAVAASACCIVSVQGLTDSEGKPYRIRREYEDGVKMLPTAQINEIGIDIMAEIGMVILTKKSPS